MRGLPNGRTLHVDSYAAAHRGAQPTTRIDMSIPTHTLPGQAGLITAGEPGYDEARTGWNLHGDLRPEGVFTARSVADVVGAVL